MTGVAVRDLSSGEETNRASDTPTVDVPAGFPAEEGVVFLVSDGFRASYRAGDGQPVTLTVRTQPLRWRAAGETCLVARSGGGARTSRQYRLCRVIENRQPAAQLER